MFRWNLVPKGAEMKKENFTMKELPDSEKAYDRITAEGTLKLILSLGFKITK